MDNLGTTLAQPDSSGRLEKAKAWIKGKAEDLRSAALGALKTSHVLELMGDSEPLAAGAQGYGRLMQQLDADRTS